MHQLVSVATSINVNPSSPNSFSPVPGLTTATNTAMAHFVATTALIPLSNTQHVINLKLTNNNYLFWHMQMKPYLIGQGVFLFVDGSTPYPSLHDLSNTVFVASATFNYGPSQTFLTWKQQDQLCCPLFQMMFFISRLIVRLLLMFGAHLNMLSPPHPNLESCNCMALFRIFNKMMILSPSTCNALKVCLMN